MHSRWTVIVYDSSVTLWLIRGSVLKSLSTPFKARVSLPSLSAKPSTSHDTDARIAVYLVRAFRMYVNRSPTFRQLDQHLVC